MQRSKLTLHALLALLLGGGLGTQAGQLATHTQPIPVPTDALTVRFSPKGGCTDLLCKEIGTAQHEIHIHIFSFTSAPVAEALIAAKARGVKVYIITDSRTAHSQWSQTQNLVDHVDAIYIDQRPGTAHNKYMIIDRTTVLTGSFNYSKNAEQNNRENLLHITKATAVAQRYLTDWEAHQKARGVTRYGHL